MNNKENERLAKLETHVTDLRLACGEIRSDIKKIMQNELPHIKEQLLKIKLTFNQKIDKLDKKISLLWLKVGVITAIGVAVIQYLIKYFLP